MPSKRIANLIPDRVRNLHAYVPGEQLKIKDLVKLNTNENPYPPSPKVLAAVKAAVDGRLGRYPNPTAQSLRNALARFHQCSPDNIVSGNGSDDLLALATRAFVEPSQMIQYFVPSYSLYPVLADIHGAKRNPVPLLPNFDIPSIAKLRKEKLWDLNAPLTFITTPNAPSGRGYRTAQLKDLCRAQKGVVILDEAYADFADGNALELALQLPNVLVARTFSKAYSLCSLRVGYCVGHPLLIAAVDKVRDSYNVNGLGQVAAEATLSDLPYYRRNIQKVIAERGRTQAQLEKLGFTVLPSATNFILTRPPGFPAERWLEELKQQKILIRWFADAQIKDFLRITVGTREDMNRLFEAVSRLTATVPQSTIPLPG